MIFAAAVAILALLLAVVIASTYLPVAIVLTIVAIVITYSLWRYIFRDS